MTESNFTDHAGEAGSFIGAGSGEPEILVDGDSLPFGPSELLSTPGERILPGRRFAVVFNLRGRRLPDINEGDAGRMGWFDLEISHGLSPSAFREEPSCSERASRGVAALVVETLPGSEEEECR
ncbi:MAG: hypothetical protein U5J83_03545 [Bryobacterales bacterium]|nr:hypothetical protein [Bryobacterales bacterium]